MRDDGKDDRQHSVDPPRWRDDVRMADGEAQFFVRSLRRPQTARPEDLARVEATVHRLSKTPPPIGVRPRVA